MSCYALQHLYQSSSMTAAACHLRRAMAPPFEVLPSTRMNLQKLTWPMQRGSRLMSEHLDIHSGNDSPLGSPGAELLAPVC